VSVSWHRVTWILSTPTINPAHSGKECASLATSRGIEWRSAEGKSERLTDLAAELVKLKVDVIVTPATPPTLAAQKATSTIPIVMANVGDPVGNGLVNSLARPGGITTGHSDIVRELYPKHLEMLLSMVLKLSSVAFLVNPSPRRPPKLPHLWPLQNPPPWRVS
jgi:ABC-type uncharacterized transport system substrate-binding protein